MPGMTCKHNLYFNSVSLALAAAIEGQGVVLTLEQLAEEDISRGRLVSLFGQTMDVEHAYHVVSLQDTTADPRVTAFKRWLFDEVELDITRRQGRQTA
jgi:LysR family glycine cleavage system transcriptional activator